MGWRARLWRELPLIIGLLLALGFLLHPGWVRFGYPHGADWDSYLGSAAHLWIDPTAFRFNEWRQPLYPWLVGLLGAGGSYVLAAQVLALVSSVGTVLGAGLMARALAAPWVAGLAAVSTALLSVVVDGSWWVNSYPLVGALTALALAAATACARWPRVSLAAVAGGLGGLCLAVDPRGMPIAVVVPLLCALGPGVVQRRGLLAALAVVGIAGGWGLDHGLQATYGLEMRPMQSQLSMQHNESRGPEAPMDGATVAESRACVETVGLDLGFSALTSDCARQRLALNQRNLRKHSHLPPVLPAVLLLGLCMIPAGWGRRSSLVLALVYLPSVAALLLGMAWVPYVDRYLLPIAALLGCLGPVALARLGGLLVRLLPAQRWLTLVGPGLAVLWVGWVFPGVHPSVLLDPVQHIIRRKGELPAPVDARQYLADWAVDTLGPDDLLLDCAELHLEILLLPHSLPLWDAPPHDKLCRERMKSPPPVDGELYLVTVHQRGWKQDPQLPKPELIEARGWDELPLDIEIDPDTHAGRQASWLRRWVWGR